MDVLIQFISVNKYMQDRIVKLETDLALSKGKIKRLQYSEIYLEFENDR